MNELKKVLADAKKNTREFNKLYRKVIKQLVAISQYQKAMITRRKN